MHILIVLFILISLVKHIDETFICIDDGKFENSDDQHTCWHCSNGNAYLKDCPTGLIWSQVEQQCVWNRKYFFVWFYSECFSQKTINGQFSL